MEKVLITGASGFIGNKLYRYFKDKDYEVYGWSYRNPLDNIPSVDMRNLEKVTKELKQINPNLIIHCAGSASVEKSINDSYDDYQNSVVITYNLFNSIKKMNIHPKVVFLSSAAVYGDVNALPIKEETVFNPISPYALHKILCEEICNYFAVNYNMPVKIARIFSVYGNGLKKQVLWDIYRKYKTEGNINLFGTGNETRDYIHIDDVAQALYLIATKKSNNTVFNVANGEEISIGELSKTFLNYMNISTSIIKFNGEIKKGDPLNWQADISRIAELGYIKKVPLKQGVEEYAAWLASLSNTIL